MADQRRQNERSQVTPEIERRGFIQAGLASAGTVLAASVLASQIGSAAVPPQTTNGADQIPRRPLGKTGERVSIIGVGGYHLGTVQSSDLAVRLVQEAVDAGVTFFDNAWEYNDHRSEEWMGLGLEGRRDKVFLMSKVCTHGRDKKVAMQQLEEFGAAMQQLSQVLMHLELLQEIWQDQQLYPILLRIVVVVLLQLMV